MLQDSSFFSPSLTLINSNLYGKIYDIEIVFLNFFKIK